MKILGTTDGGVIAELTKGELLKIHRDRHLHIKAGDGISVDDSYAKLTSLEFASANFKDVRKKLASIQRAIEPMESMVITAIKDAESGK